MRSSPLDRLCFLANESLLSLTLVVVLLDVWWFRLEAWYLPLIYLDTSSTLTVVLPAGGPLLGGHPVCLDLASTLSWHSGWHSLLCLGMADIVGTSLSWEWAWYLLLIWLDSTFPLYTLVAGISLSWILADGYSSAGRTGLGSAVLAGFVIGLGITGG